MAAKMDGFGAQKGLTAGKPEDKEKSDEDDWEDVVEEGANQATDDDENNAANNDEKEEAAAEAEKEHDEGRGNDDEDCSSPDAEVDAAWPCADDNPNRDEFFDYTNWDELTDSKPDFLVLDAITRASEAGEAAAEKGISPGKAIGADELAIAADFAGISSGPDPIALPAKAEYYSEAFYQAVKTIFFQYIVPDKDGPDPFDPYRTYSEILFFRVLKYEIDPVVGKSKKPIQNIYIPNLKKIINYFDTQVKYGKKYFYDVRAITMLIGKKYFYRNPEPPFISSGAQGKTPHFRTSVEVVVEPDVTIVEIPYKKLGIASVLGPPPLPPNIEFVSILESPGLMRILINNSNSSAYLAPIPVEESDNDLYSSIMAMQKLGDNHKGKIHFAHDDKISGYRIYRLKNKPNSLKDFAFSYTKVNTDLDATYYDDILDLNQKYYYMFRTVDIHDGPSNPSFIYEVELISLADGAGPGPIAVYPVIKGFTISEFFKGKTMPSKKSFRRYIHIKVSENQQTISNSANSAKTPYAPQFGVSVPEQKFIIGSKIGENQYSIKDRKIKIRLTSTSTGRKIDFNVAFNHIHVPYDDVQPNKNDGNPPKNENE